MSIAASQPHLLSADWLQMFLLNWNRNPEAMNAFCGVGPVDFVEITSSGANALHMFWDDDGTATAGEPGQTEAGRPTFTAPTEVWALFMSGALEPVLAVLSGKMVYRGPVAFAIGHGKSFKYVPLVMQAPESSVTLPFSSSNLQDQPRSN